MLHPHVAKQGKRTNQRLSYKGVTGLHPFDLVQVLGTQSCLTPCGPMDCSPSCSSVHGIFQASILEWVTISSFCVSCLSRQILCHCATWEAYVNMAK